LPKVSICIPAYNQIEYLKRTIDSILIQTFTDYEIVITDDSASNLVKDLVDGYNQIAKIKYFKNSTSLGSPENWNESLRNATGEYIKIMHHDDWFYNENCLKKYVALLDENPSTDFAFAATLASSEKENDYIHEANQNQIVELSNNPLVLFRNNFVGAPSTTIFRRSVNIFFDKNLKWLVDFDFYIRLLSKNKNFKYTNEVLTVTFKPEGRVTDSCENNKEVEIFEYFYLLDKQKNDEMLVRSSEYRKALIRVINICKKYSVNSIREIRSCGYIGDIPKPISQFFKLNRLNALLGNFYFYFLNTLYAK
jgi:glycosyltransferase involved in cell wall biosynthesis